MIEIQMATEGLDEKKNREKTNRKTNVDKKIRSIQEAQHPNKTNPKEKGHQKMKERK